MKYIRENPLFILLFILPLFCACKDAKKQKIEKINTLYSKRFQMSMDSMLVVNPIGLDSAYKYGDFNFILYVDSSSCSSCALGTLAKWDEYLESLRAHYNIT